MAQLIHSVIPAKAGIQSDIFELLLLDSRFRGNDGKVRKSIRCACA